MFSLSHMEDNSDVLKGFTKVPHDIIRLGLMRVNFTAWESRIFWTIWSFSWSWHKPSCYISYRELSSYSAIPLRHTHATVQSLVDKNILRVKTAKPKSKFAVNLKVKTWIVEFKKNEIQKELETAGWFRN